MTAMRLIKTIKTAGILVFIFAILATAADRIYFSNIEWKFRTSRLQKSIEAKEARAVQLINETEARLASGRGTSALTKENVTNAANKDDILLLVYYKNRISFWSDNNVSFQPLYNDSLAVKKMVFISNEWFIPVCRKSLDYDIVALIGIGKNYKIQNDILKTGFLPAYKMPESTGMSFDQQSSPFHIFSQDGKFSFAVLFPDPKSNTFFIIFPLLLWTVFFISLIFLLNCFTDWFIYKRGHYVALIFSFVAQIAFYSLFTLTSLPGSIHLTKLFSHFVFAYGKVIPSIGHLLLLSFLLLNFTYTFYKHFPFKGSGNSRNKRDLILALILLFVAFASFAVAHSVFKSMIIDSSANFEAYKILDVDLLGIAGLLSILVLLSIPMVFIICAFRVLSNYTAGSVLFLIVIYSLTLLLSSFAGLPIGIAGVLFILFESAAILLWMRSSITLFNELAIFSFFAGIYLTSMIIKFSDKKEDEAMKVMAVSIANDNDLVAESLLLDLSPKLESDTTIRRLMKKEIFTENDYVAIDKYLLDNYFNGYWDNYDFNTVICFDDSPLELPLQGSYAANCFFFFDERIKERGSQITGTNFYFINYNLGRAFYLTRLYYYVSPFLTTGLFIELSSQIENYQPGYPELLIDNATQRYPKLKDISYAKYSGGTLILHSGDYQYEDRVFKTDFSGSEYQVVNKGMYKHLLYNRGDMTVVISKAEITFFDRFITFAYIFILTLLVTFVIVLVFRGEPLEFFHFSTFKRKLQLAFSSVLVTVFAIVIMAAMFLSISKFTENHTRLLREKIKSVVLAIEMEFNQNIISTGDIRNTDIQVINTLLVRLSNVFLSDINLYNPSGELIATSRPEIFKKQLEGIRINADAFSEMMVNKKVEYIHEEKIGNLKYMSAYMPLYTNGDGSKLLGYVNLPYFRMQDLLADEISSLVVSVVNFTFVFMMLMMWIAVFISNRLTSPLQMLQRAMASVQLGRKSEHIHYKSKDEVGEMVNEYNRMIDELDDSARKLARSEREMAWREMARQIAHEIKNPLTPMKLNVQQLLRWWKDDAPDFNKRLETFTANQIEYIDNLSSIATAFSNFARMPSAEPTETDLLVQLKGSIELFGQTEGVKIILESGNYSKVMMMADKEHLNGIFSNLIKNAIQAIPAGRFGVIRITVIASFDKTQIIFKDNGSGIPEELKTKMFTPNFTTKSSGMGLGLSIVKRYVESAGGAIWFESSQDKGTTFFVELPLLYTVEKLGGKSDVEK